MKFKLKAMAFALVVAPLSLASCNNTDPGTSPSPSVNPSTTNYTINFDLKDGHSDSYNGEPIVVSAFSEDIFFFDVTKDGYNFRGWSYQDELIIDETGVLHVTPIMQESMTFVAEYSTKSKVNVQVNIPNSGTVTGSGEYDVGQTATLVATPNTGYSFEGWYSNETLVSENATYDYVVGASDITFVAKFEINEYTLSVVSSHPDIGRVQIQGDSSFAPSSSKLVKYGQEISVEVLTLDDECDFLGWYDGDELVSSLTSFILEMPAQNYSLVAKWDVPSFNVAVNLNNNKAGEVSGAGAHEYYSQVILSATTNNGYEFVGWYENGNLKSENEIYTFPMPDSNVNLEARWEIIDYTITYDLAGGTLETPNPTTYNVETTVEFTNTPTKVGNDFAHWTLDGTVVTKIEAGSGIYGDVTIVANWSAHTHDYQVSSSDGTHGTATINGQASGTSAYGASMNAVATASAGYKFGGWYDENNILVTDANPYTFTMPDENVTLKAWFYEEANETWMKNHGVIPVVNETEGTVTYGLYPQSVVPATSTTLISELNKLTETYEDTGWYLYDNEFYTKVAATPVNDNHTFDDDTPIVSGNTYWFKCEAITWNILTGSNGEYYLLSNKILGSIAYDADEEEADVTNNYKDSSIREYINGEFYNKAFMFNTYSNILITDVDNSAKTTADDSNENACENTQDKVFLPSYADYKNTSLFANADARLARTTEYARALGASNSTETGNGNYWTRSPYYDNKYQVHIVNSSGEITQHNAGSSSSTPHGGVRPAINIVA